MLSCKNINIPPYYPDIQKEKSVRMHIILLYKNKKHYQHVLRVSVLSCESKWSSVHSGELFVCIRL